ncbi:MAG: helix-turn-helix domain-containing protein, partial [Holophaga sp.]|nr:helix-turn-helix domain-containing protein [Holophaga sp.]
ARCRACWIRPATKIALTHALIPDRSIAEEAMNLRVLLTIPEFCEATAMSRNRFYEEVRAGRIKPIKVGIRSVRVPVEQVQAYLDAITKHGSCLSAMAS